MRSVFLLSCLAATGCTSLAGLDGLSFEAGGGGSTATAGGGGSSSSSSTASGGGGGKGGAGGSGGGPGGAAPARANDWSPSLRAVYGFEQEGTLGAGDPGPTLDVLGMVQGGPAQAGVLGAAFPTAGDRLDGQGDAFQLPTDGGLAITAWVKVDATPSDGPAEIVASYDSGTFTGFSLDRVDVDSLECFFGTGTEFRTAFSATGSFPLAVWKHIACVYDPAALELRVYLDGVVADIALNVAPFTGTPPRLSVPTETFPFAGNVDEVVVHDAALGEAAILRIYACGVSGASCTCDAQDPTLYTDCGRLEPGCPDALPACDAAEP